MSAGGSVLVFTPYCPGSIGEQVVQVPFLHFLRRKRPGRDVVAVVPERSGAVLERLGVVDRVVEYPVRAGLPQLVGLARTVRGTRPGELFQLRRKSWRAVVLAALSTRARPHGFAHGVNRVVQARSLRWDHGVYIAENYARLVGRSVAEFAAEGAGGSVAATPDGTAVTSPAAASGYILFIPGGLTPIKRYPIEQYVTVARALGRDRPVRFLLGPGAERERAALSALGEAVHVDVAPPMDEVGQLVRRAALVIANDCGPGHFAHIHDVPRVCVFDRSIDPAPWFFPGRNGTLVRSEAPGEIGRIPPDAILGRAREILEAAS